ncbi:hypothetical protein Tco_0374037 [Tanacetum coccineum]
MAILRRQSFCGLALDDVFKNNCYLITEDDEDLTFLPKDFSPGFNIGSPYVSINTEPVRADEKPTVEPDILSAFNVINASAA